MSFVYLVSNGDYEDNRVGGVYSTWEQAKAECNRLNLGIKWQDGSLHYPIERLTLDAPLYIPYRFGDANASPRLGLYECGEEEANADEVEGGR